MPPAPPRRLDADQLLALAREAHDSGPCEACGPLCHPGWESMPSDFDVRRLTRVGTLRDEAVEEPTLAEHHPQGTHGWSPDAPIAPGFHALIVRT